MNSFKIFQGTWALNQLPATLKLYGTEWRFLICSDGKTPVDQIQRRLGLSLAEGDAIVKRLCESGLLTESTLSLEDFARSTVDLKSSSSQPQNFQEHLAGLDSSPPSAAKEKPVPAFSPLQKPSAPLLPMSLQAVIQFILNHHSDPTSGQLATYQVFMGIGTPLLKRKGITSLRFQDDRTITDPELQTAIIESIQKTLKVSCTTEMFTGRVSAPNKQGA